MINSANTGGADSLVTDERFSSNWIKAAKINELSSDNSSIFSQPNIPFSQLSSIFPQKY
jgi:hypothetical protein